MTHHPLTIANEVARRYLLGQQGLWPGRRWAGKAGAAEAIHQLGAVQIDPLNVVARSHDLVLWSRVAGYEPAHLDALLYQDRAFFDYGGLLMIYPMAELPYWRTHMRRRLDQPRQQAFAAEHGALLDEVRAALRQRGPLANRDFAGNARVSSYRARKDTGLALYHLWLTGELMTHARRGFERLYGFREDVAPAEHAWEATTDDAERFFARKSLSSLIDASAWAGTFAYRAERRLGRAEARRWLDELVAAGEAAMVQIEGRSAPCYLPAADLPLLEELANGEIPAAWRPLGPTTEEEVTFLAPLDAVLDRARLRWLFGFEYLWEVYKPAAQRRWGYYTLPILYGDRFVARLDPKLDRATGTLVINGFWSEDDAITRNPAFTAALDRGLARFATFLGADRIAGEAIGDRR